MNELRKEVLDYQWGLETGHAFRRNNPLLLETWKKTEGRPLGERFAIAGKDRLEAANFMHSAKEPLIGRVIKWNIDDATEQAAEAQLKKLGYLNPGGQNGHMEPFYDDIFTLGLDGLKEKVADVPSFVIAAEAFSEWIEKAATQAVREDVAEACRHIAHHPPRTFQEAIQLMWFIDCGIHTADCCHLIGPGRIDRRLYPWYEADIKAGRLTREEALNMIALLYLFLNNLTGRGLAYAVMVGGNGQYNELSYLALEALRISGLTYPSVGVCWEEATPPELRKLTAELIAEGYSNIAVFNDRIIRKAMVHYGVPEEDAHEYINSTCVEITPCGDSNVYVASPYFPLCIILMEYLENSTAEDYETFRREYLDLLEEKIRAGVEVQNKIRHLREEYLRRPLQSLFTKSCVRRKRDIEEGGAGYNWGECSFVGLANLVDSLGVIRHEVFEQKNFTLAELRDILKTDFKDNEPLRLRFLNGYPKYGNANPEGDGEITVIMDRIAHECSKYKMYPGDTHFIPGTFCWIQHQKLGEICGATPDGRHAGFPFADGAGPAQGREKNGPTAAVASVCSWDHSKLLGGTAFNQRYTSAVVSTPEARKKLENLIDVFISNGGFETQINILDAETLKDAQLHPEEYRDLVVRIGGYTDYFVGLEPGMQAEVIMRTLYQEF